MELEGFERAWQRSQDIKGWYSREELEFLWNELQTLNPLSNVLEIGCYYGRSTATIAEVCARRGASLWVIDAFHHRGEDIPEAKASTLKVLKDSEASWKLLGGRTEEIDPRDLPKWFDAIHIDGSHEARDVVYDCILALPRVRSGGIAAFHDWADYMPTVSLGASLFVKDWGTVGQAGSVRILRKP